MSTLGDIMSTSGDVQYIGVFNRNWKDFIKLLPHMYHDIPPMYWTSPHVLMISPRCTHGIPPMYWTSPMYWTQIVQGGFTFVLNLGSTLLRITGMVFFFEENFGQGLGVGRTSCTNPWWRIRLRRPFSLSLLRLSASLNKGEAVLIHKM